MLCLLLPASLTLLFSPLMMMHKPHFSEITTENLGGRYRRRERDLGFWAPRALGLRMGPCEGERMRGQGTEHMGRQKVQRYKIGVFSRLLPP